MRRPETKADSRSAFSDSNFHFEPERGCVDPASRSTPA